MEMIFVPRRSTLLYGCRWCNTIVKYVLTACHKAFTAVVKAMVSCKKTSRQQLVRQWRHQESYRPPSGGRASIGGGSAVLQRRQDGSAKASLSATPDIAQLDYSRQWKSRSHNNRHQFCSILTFELVHLVIYTVSQKNDTDVAGYIFNAHQPILIVFGR